jgi:hypothetical protein
MPTMYRSPGFRHETSERAPELAAATVLAGEVGGVSGGADEQTTDRARRRLNPLHFHPYRIVPQAMHSSPVFDDFNSNNPCNDTTWTVKWTTKQRTWIAIRHAPPPMAAVAG